MYKKMLIFLFLISRLHTIEYTPAHELARYPVENINKQDQTGATGLHYIVDQSTLFSLMVVMPKMDPQEEKARLIEWDIARAVEAAIFVLNGANPHTKSTFNLTPLDIAETNKASLPYTHKVVQWAADSQTQEIRDLLKRPEFKDHLVKTFGKDISDLPAKDLYHTYIAKKNYEEYVKALNKRDEMGETPLYQPVHSKEILSTALSRGITQRKYFLAHDINQALNAGIFILNGAQTDIRNRKKLSPLDIAESNRKYLPYIYQVIKLGTEQNHSGIRQFFKKPDVQYYSTQRFGKDISDAVPQELLFLLRTKPKFVNVTPVFTAQDLTLALKNAKIS